MATTISNSTNFSFEQLLRPHLKSIEAYSSARSEFSGSANVFLDANENPYSEQFPYHRYPDPLQKALKAAISGLKGISADHLFLGNGSDEAIDLLMRAFCEPKTDNILILPPTYGMYKTSAEINGIEIKRVNLEAGSFELDAQKALDAVDKHTKMIFICTPNNPTGNNISDESIKHIARQFKGLVVVDEAYIDFSPNSSWIHFIKDYPNMVVLQTLSKAWGLAGIRVGMAFAHPSLIQILNTIKPPYNINSLSQEQALKVLAQPEKMRNTTEGVIKMRQKMAKELLDIPYVKQVFPSHANFLLVQVSEADKLCILLREKGVIIRNRSKEVHCEGCVRITIGTEYENNILMREMKALAEVL
ncbi:MAG: histidinol-phosphate transaminase [Cyclobacteriaceae bacterium]|nr:histidinol-phosphate transaminase [Cyclobacteriaceae bacterium]MCH8515392.1 histidinol-phosphate transaminase [Cyclobacteriaceae bacterium]